MSDDDLLAIAAFSREKAYVPYSGFKVGAAILTVSGEAFGGCNIENISYGLTMCAERVALGSALESGFRDFIKIAILAESMEPIVPCGACRQVLAEFSPNLSVLSKTVRGVIAELNLSLLLPKPCQGILG